MKKLTTLWLMILMLSMSVPVMGAMSMNKMRQNARFLTDRMAHELNLTLIQYNDVYEVNYDFIYNIRHIMDDVVRGNDHAVNRYYQFLDYRNDDLRWILSASQYRRFMGVDYFFRPVYTTGTNWLFRIFKVYRDVNHFYFDKPHHYKSYKGRHYRTHFNNVSYYKKHRNDYYKHDFYKGDIRARKESPGVTPNVESRPKGNSRPVPDRKEIKPSDVKRNSNQQVISNKKKGTESGRVKERKPDLKKDNRRKGETNSRNSKKVNKESGRVVRDG